MIQQPKTMYGASKVFNELLGDYYQNKYGVDFRSVRYPGVISSAKYDFNGTTDYTTGKFKHSINACSEIFFEALEKGRYSCYLSESTALPMIYIDQCIDATLMLMKADKAKLTKTTYNLGGISFTPGQFIPEVQKLIPGLEVTYDIL